MLVIVLLLVVLAAAVEGVLLYYLAQQKSKEQQLSRQYSTRISELDEDVSASLAREKELGNDRDWFITLFNNTNDLVFVHGITPDGLPANFLEVNAAICHLLGHTRDEMLQMTPMDIEFAETPVASMGYSKSDLVTLSDNYVKDQHDKIATRTARMYIGKILTARHITEERVFQDKNGKKIPIEVNAQLFDVGGDRLIMCTAKDITERKQAEESLSESRQRFRDFFASSPVGIAIYNGKRELVDVNTACLKMFGVPDRDQFSRFNVFDNPFLSADARRRLNVGESVHDEWILDFGQAVRKSLFITSKIGQAYFDVMLNNMGLDREYRPRGYFALVQDITDRRNAENELKKTESQLRQAEKMEAIGSMAGGIAHDFNNILTPIVGYAKMLLKTSPEGTPANKYAQGISKASSRAKDLVAQILTFSRKSDEVDVKSLKPIHILPVVKEVIQLQRTALPKEIELNRVIKTEHDIVVADPTKIHQVLMNLSTNAWHAMRDKCGSGTLEVMVSDFVIDPRGKSTEFPQLKPGRYLRISIKDTGTGIEPHVLKRMFEPFFTTKKVGEGTGMGLAVVHGVITSLSGALSVDTEVGKGTTFHIVLPSVDEKALEPEREKDTPMLTGNETVLVVDDESDITEMIALMLVSLGYKPVVAGSGPEALQVFTQSPDQFDVLIVDQVMPGMKGVDLVAKIRATGKGVPVILCTSFADEITPEDMQKTGAKGIITKPIAMEVMAEMLRKALPPKPGQNEVKPPVALPAPATQTPPVPQ